MIYYLFTLIIVFISVVVWVYADKRRRRFEQDGRIPFSDDRS